jgi:hypothetical protein
MGLYVNRVNRLRERHDARRDYWTVEVSLFIMEWVAAGISGVLHEVDPLAKQSIRRSGGDRWQDGAPLPGSALPSKGNAQGERLGQ